MSRFQLPVFFRVMVWFFFWILFFFAIAITGARADDGLPLVCEHMDEIYVISVNESNYSRLVFVRESETPGHDIVATRLLLDEMVWTIDEKTGKPCVMWRDWWSCERIVTFDQLICINLPYDPTQESNRGQWWNAARVMSDLRSPQ